MRKFFSFRSSVSGNVDNNPNPNPPDPRADQVYWEKPWQSDEDVAEENSARIPKGRVLKSSKSYSKKKDSDGSRLRRSLSFSSASVSGGSGDGYFNSLVNPWESPSNCGNDSHLLSECSSHSQPLTPERLPKCKRHDFYVARKTCAFGKNDFLRSSEDYPEASGKSPYGSPVRLKHRASRVTQVPNENETLDLYIDGEKQETEPNNEDFPSSIANGGCLVENRVLVNSGRPPRAHSMAPSSPISSKENFRSQSVKDGSDSHHFLSTHDWRTGDFKSTSPEKPRKKFVRRFSQALGARSKMKSQEYDSVTTTTEDIYEDTSELQQGLSLECNVLCCSGSHYPKPCRSVSGCCSENSLYSHGQNCYVGDHPWNIKNEDDVDKELNIKLKEAEEMFILYSEINVEPEKLQGSDLCISVLFQTIRDINEDRKNLALELLTQTKHRIAERSLAKDVLKETKVSFDTKIKRLEKEKNDLQTSLENELDRRSSDWSLKLEKFQAEEQRLRERVRELAEQNVSLQREVSSLNGREAETRSRIVNLETQLIMLTARLEEVETENQNLKQSLTELRQRCESVEADKERIERSYKAKEKENKELQNIVVRFQRICSGHEKTIAGLRQGRSDETAKQPTEKGDLVSGLQLEQMRLSGVEQTLRKEVESYRQEIESLRQENVYLLDRLQSFSSGCGFPFKLEHEMHARLDSLQNQGLSLLHENNKLCGKLLDLLKSQQLEHDQQTGSEIDGIYVVEYDVKFLGLRRGIENFRNSLQTLSLVMDKKSHLQDLDCQSQPTETGTSKQWTNKMSKDNIEHELKAEIMVTRILREKLCSKELELEQLQEELASSIRGHEVLRQEVQRLQEELSSLNHRTKDMTLQMLKKEDDFNQLKHEFEQCTKELIVSRDTLPKVSEERDRLWAEVNRLKEMDMLLKYEVNSLKKKIETLEEEILVKEGQITILKDSLGNKSFDILCALNSLEEHTL